MEEEKEEAEKYRTILIRKVPEELYYRMWALRKAYGAKSWVDLFKKITDEHFAEETERWI